MLFISHQLAVVAHLTDRVAVMHHGPFSSGRHGGNVRLTANGIVPILRDGKVELIFAGHDHAYERGEGQGLKYIISGGAGAPLYSRDNRAPETQIFESVHHFLEVAVEGDKMTVLARRAAGSVIETCSFRGMESWSCSAGDGKGKATSASTPGQAPGSAPPATKASSSSCFCSAAGAPSSVPSGRLFAAGAAALAGLVAARRFGRRREA